MLIHHADRKAEHWVNSVIEGGTIRDRVSGLVLTVQQSPFHRLATLDQLLSLARTPTARISILAIISIKTLFLASYLPDHKLVRFNKHFESLSEEEGEKVEIQQLVRWYYEDAVKIRYAAYVQTLEVREMSKFGAKCTNIVYRKKHIVTCPSPKQKHLVCCKLSWSKNPSRNKQFFQF